MDKLPLRVSQERWKQAQEWELGVWRSLDCRASRRWRTRLKEIVKGFIAKGSCGFGDDWNFWWAERFDGYQSLPAALENAVELGCGLYTNMRLILENRRIRHVYCSDPLIREYLTLKKSWLAGAWVERNVLVDDHPIEECPFASDYFDLVVLVNVLDHVRDGIVGLRQAIRITKRGGYLVVGQDLSNAEDIVRVGDDIGHPIRIDHSTLDEELMPHFETVLYRILKREEGRNPEAHYGTYIFIGRKSAPTSSGEAVRHSVQT
ncbi:MAG: class I SAM-dependent methyltransferase [Anaerolineae bacterium]